MNHGLGISFRNSLICVLCKHSAVVLMCCGAIDIGIIIIITFDVHLLSFQVRVESEVHLVLNGIINYIVYYVNCVHHQILDMKENELGMLATHLGHDPKTHKEYYRLSSATVELTTVRTRVLYDFIFGLKIC